MTAFHVYADAAGTAAHPDVRRISFADLSAALRAGLDDFMEMPSHLVFIGIIYPLVGVVLATWTSGANALPLLFPLASGFALIGPVAAIGLYEISRRREQGLPVSWRDALAVRRSPALPSIIAVGVLLLAVFLAWLLVARGLYVELLGPEPPASMAALLDRVFNTREGWTLFVVGNLIGLIFAILALCTSIVAFPLLLDRDVGAWAAVQTSWRAAMTNPVEIAAWGLIVAALLVLGSLPIFAGLAVVVPILGHATWHLYRRLVAAPPPERRAAAATTRRRRA
ncbi:MAG: DUF2189 domain-containing protein [Rhizobiales bacterium]|nr:DUF2189 domain-containing protein [Hyphomicrobiales bacterium]OJU33368.1 MAG: hypothetical protein BGN94_23600 [Rhizobiales bacterium 68-8]